MAKRLLLLAAILLGFAFYVNSGALREEVPIKKDLALLPLAASGWQGRNYYFDDLVLDKLRVSNYIMRNYRRGDQGVSLYIGYYASQREGAQIHSPKHCLPGGGWQNLSESIHTIPLDGGRTLNYVQSVYEKEGVRDVFIYWYKMKNVSITNEYLLKAYMIINSFKYRRNDAAFIRLSATSGDDIEGTVATLQAFMHDFVPLLDDYLPE